MFPNTFRLQAYLGFKNADQVLIDPELRRLDTFPVRVIQNQDTLSHKNHLDLDEIAGWIGQLFDQAVESIELVSRAELDDDSRRMEQYHAFLCAENTSLRKLLLVSEPYRALWDAYANDRYYGRTLEDMVSAAVGTHTLRQKFDDSFGHDFSSVFKDDIVTVWTLYLACIIEKNAALMPPLSQMIELLGRTRSVGCLQKDPMRWLLMVK